MANDNVRLFPGITWSQFNSDFHIPEGDDAARVAAEVRASIEPWIQNSLAKLEQDISARAQVVINALNGHIKETNGALDVIQTQIATLQEGLVSLASPDPALQQSINNLQAQTDAARKGMADAATKWEQYGEKTVATIEQILGTVAKFAV
jgi:uncharacterized protein involved in exopolysaccharide biosynthesis